MILAPQIADLALVILLIIGIVTIKRRRKSDRLAYQSIVMNKISLLVTGLWFISSNLNSPIGGLGSSKGFPFTYAHSDFFYPGNNYDTYWLIPINFLLLYLVCTSYLLIARLLHKDKSSLA